MKYCGTSLHVNLVKSAMWRSVRVPYAAVFPVPLLLIKRAVWKHIVPVIKDISLNLNISSSI